MTATFYPKQLKLLFPNKWKTLEKQVWGGVRVGNVSSVRDMINLRFLLITGSDAIPLREQILEPNYLNANSHFTTQQLCDLEQIA